MDTDCYAVDITRLTLALCGRPDCSEACGQWLIEIAEQCVDMFTTTYRELWLELAAGCFRVAA